MSVEILVKIDKTVLRESMMCGINNPYVSENCAVTKAVQVLFPHCTTEYTYIKYNGYRINLPKEVALYIRKFDSLYITPEQRLNLPEIEFTIEVSDELLQQFGNMQEVYTILENSNNMKLA